MSTILVSFNTIYDTKTETIRNAKVKNKGDFLEFDGENKKLTIHKSQILHYLELKDE